MDQAPQVQRQSARKHSALFYNTSQERLYLLADFVQSGLENGELCIFITPDTTQKVVEEFQAMGLDVQPDITDGRLRIFNMLSTYIPDGRFVSNYIINNLESYMDDAKALGYHGIRIAGEMNWLHDRPDANDGTVRYEQSLNHLPLVYPTSILCLYPTRDMATPFAKSILKQHPSFAYDGKQYNNPYYKLSEMSPTPETGTESKKTNSSRTPEMVVALEAIKKLLASLKKGTD